eukprot:11163756-Lingulodinium_polyedra.AAC.1
MLFAHQAREGARGRPRCQLCINVLERVGAAARVLFCGHVSPALATFTMPAAVAAPSSLISSGSRKW